MPIFPSSFDVYFVQRHALGFYSTLSTGLRRGMQNISSFKRDKDLISFEFKVLTNAMLGINIRQ